MSPLRQLVVASFALFACSGDPAPSAATGLGGGAGQPSGGAAGTTSVTAGGVAGAAGKSSGAGGGGGASAGSGVGGQGGAGAAGSSGGAAGKSGQAGGAGSGAGGQSGGAGKAPTFFVDFVSSDPALFDVQSPLGAITFGADDAGAHDGKAAALLWNANTAAIGPGGKATEIGSKALFGFGEYRFRTKLGTCAANEDLVNGHFVYQNDGKDHDGNGLIDNDEIDIEILCGQPGFLNLSSWTDYTDDTHLRKKSRIIDLDSGTILVGTTDGYGVDQSDPETNTVDAALKHPGWYDPTAYYEMGWSWQKGSLRFFFVLAGKELTLWTFTDASRIPQHPATMRFNLWHPSDHWNEAGTALPAKKPSTLSLDWFAFTATP